MISETCDCGGLGCGFQPCICPLTVCERCRAPSLDLLCGPCEAAFEVWVRQLDEDVIQGEYGYEPGEFTVFAEHWRPLYSEGLSPLAAFKRALAALRP